MKSFISVPTTFNHALTPWGINIKKKKQNKNKTLFTKRTVTKSSTVWKRNQPGVGWWAHVRTMFYEWTDSCGRQIYCCLEALQERNPSITQTQSLTFRKASLELELTMWSDESKLFWLCTHQHVWQQYRTANKKNWLIYGGGLQFCGWWLRGIVCRFMATWIWYFSQNPGCLCQEVQTLP